MESRKKKPLKASLASRIFYGDPQNQNEEERLVLDKILKRLQLGYCNIEKSERPDFFLNFSRGEHAAVIACELTDFYMDAGIHGSAQRRFVVKWKDFAKKLRKRLDEECEEGKYYYGAIHFKSSDFEILDKFDINLIINEIISLVVTAKDISELKDFSRTKSPVLFQHVSHIYLRDTRPETDILWWPAHLQSGLIEDPRERLIAIVSDKNSAARNYLWKKSTEKWLVIFSASEGVSDMVGLYSNPEIRDKLGDLVFDKVYVWNKFFESIDEIYPEFKNLFSAGSELLYRSRYPESVRAFIVEPEE